MIETCRLKNVVIFIKTILSFVLSWKIINISFYFRLFPRKTNDKIFEKLQKEPLWALFDQIWAKSNFAG